MLLTYASFLLCNADGSVNASKAIYQPILQGPCAAPDPPLGVLLQLLLGHPPRLCRLVPEGGICKLCAAVKEVLFFRREASGVPI